MLPFTETCPIEEVLDWPQDGDSIRLMLIDTVWDSFHRQCRNSKKKGAINRYYNYNRLAGRRYLTTVTWDAENFIVTIYDAKPDTEPDSQT